MDNHDNISFTISSLTKVLQHYFFDIGDFNIKGEVTNFVASKAGHWYFSLKDDNSQLKAVMFKGYNCISQFQPEDGKEVECKASITLYEGKGEMQLMVTKIKETGYGNIFKEFIKLKNELEKEGIFDKKYKKQIPQYISHLAVVTSSAGAAWHDIVSVVRKRAPLINLTLIHAAVQGEGSVESIASSINKVNELPNQPDILIIGRGGGSFEDLNSFNSREVAYAIFKCNIPIISAVGHETDFTISDMVADIRAPTPSAAAQIASYDTSEVLFQLSANRQAINKRVKLILISNQHKMTNLKNKIDNILYLKIKDFKNNLYHKKINLNVKIKDFIQKKEHQLLIYKEKLNNLNPKKMFSKGFAIVSIKGERLDDSRAINIGDELEIHQTNKNITAIVNNIKYTK